MQVNRVLAFSANRRSRSPSRRQSLNRLSDRLNLDHNPRVANRRGPFNRFGPFRLKLVQPSRFAQFKLSPFNQCQSLSRQRRRFDHRLRFVRQ